MKGTVLPVLLAAYRAGNRRPRGVVIERLKWAGYVAEKRARCLQDIGRRYPRMVGQAAYNSISLQNTGCMISAGWTQAEDRQLVTMVLSGASIETMACKHMRTHGAIKSRLGHFDMIVWSGRGYRLCPVHTYDIPPRMRHITKVLKAWGYEGTTVLTPPIGIYNREIAWL